MSREWVKHKTCQRWNQPGDAHELTFGTFGGYKLLARERTCRWLVDTIAKARLRHDFAVIAYVIMPEHVHLLLLPRRTAYDISTILKAIKFPVAWRARRFLESTRSIWLSKLADHGRTGRGTFRFWQRGGGYDRNVQNYETLGSMVDYIHNNPVRRGLCAQTTDWEWSSARWYEGEREDVPLSIDDDAL
jgi:putative transposase